MRRTCLGGLLAVCLLAGLMPGALAAGPQVVAMKLNSPWCVIGAETVLVDPQNRDVVPTNEGGRTLVPIGRVLEAFGGEVGYVHETRQVTCALNGKQVKLTLGSATADVDGVAVTLDVPAQSVNGRTFVPVRFVTESLGLHVSYESTHQIVVVSNSPMEQGGLATLPAVTQLVSRTVDAGDPTALTSGSYTLPSGTVSANIITVNMKDPRVSVRMEMVDNKLNTTRPFADIVAASGAVAVINGNFFESNQAIKDPIGHVMSNGIWLYGNSGTSALGITSDNQMRYGRPPLFVRIKTADQGKAQEWSAYSVNIMSQSVDSSVLYTPARGSAVPITSSGAVLTVENGVTTGYRAIAAGESLNIPWNGFTLFMGSNFIATHYFAVPELGRTVVQEPYLPTEDKEGFTLPGVQAIVSGAPRLITDGAIDQSMDPGFTEPRFTTVISSRTAVGTTADGKLLLVNVSKANIQQMRELMLQLGCVDAINLDGGASTGMYYRGKTLSKPGRELTTTLQIFVDE